MDKIITHQALSEKAKYFHDRFYANEAGKKPFNGSSGFVDNFLSRYSIKLSGAVSIKSKKVDPTTKFFTDLQEDYLKNYTLDQIYNADEWGFYFKGKLTLDSIQIFS